jgi:hypothetical protein
MNPGNALVRIRTNVQWHHGEIIFKLILNPGRINELPAGWHNGATKRQLNKRQSWKNTYEKTT